MSDAKTAGGPKTLVGLPAAHVETEGERSGDLMSEAKVSGPKTLVEEGTQFKGSLSSKCPIEVKGRIEGDLTAPSLTVSATGAVHGKIRVGELQSEGEIAGEFDADIVRLSGTVKDNTVVRAKSLEVKLAPEGSRMQVIFGECALEIGDMPTRDDQPPKAKDKADKADKSEKMEQRLEKAADKAEKGKSIPPPAATKGERPSVAPPAAEANGAS
jgi:cytoskeletal protein CcmA (bactofilin family)